MATATGGSQTAIAKPIPPNRTLYVRNLPDQLRKDDLKRNLYILFATYGVVLDVIALKTLKMRGQAHVVFRDADSSTQAMRALEGFTFFGKEMNIHYAKGKSDTIAKLDGTFALPVQEVEASTALQTKEQETVFGSGAAPAKAVPVNAPDDTKGVKRGRDDESEAEDSDQESAMDVSDSE